MNDTEPRPEQGRPAADDSAVKAFTAYGCTVFDISGAPDQGAALGEALGRTKTLEHTIILINEARAVEARYQLSAAGRDRGIGHVLLAQVCHIPAGTIVQVSGGKHAGKDATMVGRNELGRFWVLVPGHGPGLVLEGDFQARTEESAGESARAKTD